MKLYISIFIILCAFSSFSQPVNYPIPDKRFNQLFYIQRNHNKNTVIYDANFDKKGNIIETNPIDVYWRRYEEEGQRKELGFIEKKFAFGAECKKISLNSDIFLIEFRATDVKQFYLKQTAPFKATVFIMINGTLSRLDHLYIVADSSSFWPKVKYIEIMGTDIKTNEDKYEKLVNP